MMKEPEITEAELEDLRVNGVFRDEDVIVGIRNARSAEEQLGTQKQQLKRGPQRQGQMGRHELTCSWSPRGWGGIFQGPRAAGFPLIQRGRDPARKNLKRNSRPGTRE